MKNTRILICEDSIEGILSGVYEAYTSRYGLHNIELQLGGCTAQERLFTEYIHVDVNAEAARRVAKAIQTKISEYAFKVVYQAACADDVRKAQAIYRFIIYGFHMGTSVLNYLSDDSVRIVTKLSKMVGMETQKLYGFVRFEELDGNVLFSVISPRHNQIPLLKDHFADRFPLENWVICDDRRRLACFHPKSSACQLVQYDTLPFTENFKAARTDGYEALWKSFCKAITIDSRKNSRQQMNMMPKRYWKHLPEMQAPEG